MTVFLAFVAFMIVVLCVVVVVTAAAAAAAAANANANSPSGAGVFPGCLGTWCASILEGLQ